MELLKKLQSWYQIHCDGDWEHSYGVVIDTLDNPGWKLSIDLKDTLLENEAFQSVCEGNPENKNGFWIDCHKKDNTFIGMGSVDSLEKLLSIFFEWFEHNCDTSGWDASPVRIANAARMKSAGPMTLFPIAIFSGINPSGSIEAAHFTSSSLVRVSGSMMAQGFDKRPLTF